MFTLYITLCLQKDQRKRWCIIIVLKKTYIDIKIMAIVIEMDSCGVIF